MDETQDPVAMYFDAKRSIPARDVTHRFRGEPICLAVSARIRISIHRPSPHGRRLHDELGLASREEWNDGLAPASMVRELDDIRPQACAADAPLRRQPDCRHGLDVA
jgi:hypothetical protein